MSIFLKIITESFLSAFAELRNNKLRTALSLMGISIGIICIVSVLAAVYSLNRNIVQSLSSLGNDVLYIQKWPWVPESGEEYKWWEYYRRPSPKLAEMEQLQQRSKMADATAMLYMRENITAKYADLDIKNVTVNGITFDYNKIKNFELEQGRYFTEDELNIGKQAVVIGATILDEMNVQDPIGKKITLFGRNYTIIGSIKKEGNDLLGFTIDNNILMPYHALEQVGESNADDPFIMTKPKEGVRIDNFKYELKGILRNIRRLKPADKDDFSFNQISLMSGQMDSMNSTLNTTGIIIGGFSILVGAFGVANIMFVSVRERTSQIGIKKALGAKSVYILLEFLIESILLCIVGGLIGVIVVGILFAILNYVLAQSETGFHLYLTISHMLSGLIISVISGIIAGFVPALSASNLHPVEAIRS